jgi:hypothetical protein
MSVKRYDFFPEYGYGEIIPNDIDGDFVKYKDYAELEQNFFSRDMDCAAKDILIAQQAAEIDALKESRKIEMKAYDELQDAFIDLNLVCDELRQQVATQSTALRKIAAWGGWGVFPEKYNPEWCAMAITTARELSPIDPPAADKQPWINDDGSPQFYRPPAAGEEKV